MTPAADDILDALGAGVPIDPTTHRAIDVVMALVHILGRAIDGHRRVDVAVVLANPHPSVDDVAQALSQCIDAMAEFDNDATRGGVDNVLGRHGLAADPVPIADYRTTHQESP